MIDIDRKVDNYNIRCTSWSVVDFPVTIKLTSSFFTLFRLPLTCLPERLAFLVLAWLGQVDWRGLGRAAGHARHLPGGRHAPGLGAPTPRQLQVDGAGLGRHGVAQVQGRGPGPGGQAGHWGQAGVRYAHWNLPQNGQSVGKI